EQEHHVEWSSCRPGERRSGRHRPEREPARCADDQDAGPLADPELVRERRRRVVAVSGRRSRGGHVRHCSGVRPRATSFGGSLPCIAWDHRDMGGYLYVVGPPIGNLADLSARPRPTLATVDLVAAEDTRRTGRLLEHIGVKVRMLSLFEGNERQRIDELLDRLRDGERVALVSGPGFRLLRSAAEAGIQIRVVPGPSAVTAALVVSGLPTDRWVFEGFLPRRPSERRERLRALAHDPRTVVLFESPLRVITLLREVLVELGDRRAVVARELTKLHEEVVRGRISEVIASLLDAEPRGELVVVIEGAEAVAPDLDEMVEDARRLVADGMRKREGAAGGGRGRGGSANEIYGALVDPGGSPDGG